MEPACLGRFLADWHGLSQPRKGLDALLSAIEKLQGAPLPASTLEEELEAVDEWIAVETLRFGERLRYHTEVPAERLDDAFPRWMLQPIVENAIYHGIEPAPAGGVIEISARTGGGRFEIEVVNPALPGTGGRHQGNRIALGNVRERLRAHFGERAVMEASLAGGYYRVRLSVPLSEAP